MKTIEAVYEGGVFRPTGEVTLAEGTHVEVIVPQPAEPRDPKAVAAKLARLAAQAPRRDERETTSRDHDQILYGGKQQP